MLLQHYLQPQYHNVQAAPQRELGTELEPRCGISRFEAGPSVVTATIPNSPPTTPPRTFDL